MDRFPWQRDLGDLLGLGIEVQPEQERLVESPSGLVVAVNNIPDPYAESGSVWHQDGKPLVVPVVYKVCTPDEVWGAGKTLGELLAQQPAEHWAEQANTDLLEHPGVISEVSQYTDEAPLWLGDQIMDEHWAKPAWDVYPISPKEALSFTVALRDALDRMCFNEINDYINWENGSEVLEDDADIEHVNYVIDKVETERGVMKSLDDFPPYSLDLPPELQYIWDRLRDGSQQSWTSVGLTLPARESKQFFNPPLYVLSGRQCPWF